MEVYQVGGAVRDRLLGRKVKEQDYVVVGASPEELITQGFKPVGKDFPVFLHPITHEEYALARTERKKKPGYTGFSFYAAPEVTLEEDLKRRDLTINAMAEKTQGGIMKPEITGEIIDPYQGRQDLERKRLRHVSSAFIEDPVRILRVARFMARFADLGFHVAEETLALMKVMVSNGEVDALVPERIWREFSIALTEPRPVAFIKTLRDCDALARICPELDLLFEIKTSSVFSKQANMGEVALHTLQKASELTEDPLVRFASLMQYIAQGNVSNIQLAQGLVTRWRLPAAYRDLLLLSIQYSRTIHEISEKSPDDIVLLLERLDSLRRPQRFQNLLTVCEADYWSREVVHEKQGYPSRIILSTAREIIQAVSVKPLVAAGYKGKGLASQLYKARVEALKNAQELL